jgi:hypothetical protein
MALVWTKPPTEMSTRNVPGCKERPARKVENLIAIREPLVYKMWGRPRSVTVVASTYQKRSPLSFLSTIEELLGRKNLVVLGIEPMSLDL